MGEASGCGSGSVLGREGVLAAALASRVWVGQHLELGADQLLVPVERRAVDQGQRHIVHHHSCALVFNQYVFLGEWPVLHSELIGEAGTAAALHFHAQYGSSLALGREATQLLLCSVGEQDGLGGWQGSRGTSRVQIKRDGGSIKSGGGGSHRMSLWVQILKGRGRSGSPP